MKKGFYYLVLLASLVTMGCNKPKVIPDDVLGKIFHDAMLTNSYINNVMVKADSLNFYEPILESYGYTSEDLQNTIVNFSRRKSARLSDVAEHMILLLEREAMVLEKQVAVLDTIDNVARRHFTETLLYDTLIVATTPADSTLLHFEVPFAGPGDYRFDCIYTLDSLDKTSGRRYHIDWLREDSTTTVASSGHLTQGVKRNFNFAYTIREDNTNIGFVISLNHVQERITRPGKPSILKNKTNTPRITINEIKVTYEPSAKVSVAKLYEEQLNARVLSDTLLQYIEQKAKEN